jgi:hypothetical protein
VLVHIALLRELESTVRTLKWPFSGVNSNVVKDIADLHKEFIAALVFTDELGHWLLCFGVMGLLNSKSFLGFT